MATTKVDSRIRAAEKWPFGGLSAEGIAQLVQVSVRTARRWQRERRAPASVCLLAEILLHGELGLVHKTWEGFRLADGELWCDGYRRPFTPSELQSTPFTADRVRSLERTVGTLETALLEANERAAGTDAALRSRDALYIALGQVTLLMRLAIAAANDFSASGDRSLIALRDDMGGTLRSIASLLAKLHQRARPPGIGSEEPSPAQLDDFIRKLMHQSDQSRSEV